MSNKEHTWTLEAAMMRKKLSTEEDILMSLDIDMFIDRVAEKKQPHQ